MEAPEKVYLHLTTGSYLLNGKYYECKPAKIRFDDKIIDYTRTDAFIEKAVSYIQQNWIWNTKMIEDFKKYMKGE